MKRPLSDKRPIGPFAQLDKDNSNTASPATMVMTKVDVSNVDQKGGELSDEFEENMVNVIADAVAEVGSARGTMSPPTPVNFDDAVMFQVLPVPVGEDFEAAVSAMLYDEDLSVTEDELEDNLNLRTGRVVDVEITRL